MNKKSLPKIGSTYAFPVEDGRFSACRVIGSIEEGKDSSVKVVCANLIESIIPSLDNAQLKSILFINHHSWNNSPVLQWVSEAIPKNFVFLGVIPPTIDETKLECSSYGGWASLTLQPLAQWIWDNDREQSDKNDKVKEEQYQKKRKELEVSRKKYLESITLEKLSARNFFPTWDEYPSDIAKKASIVIMRNTIKKLISLPLDADESLKILHLKDCIVSFNEIDEKYDNFIETIEREDICEEFEGILYACKLGHLEDLVDEWRDW